LSKNSENKEELLTQVDGIIKTVKLVFIIVLLLPFVFYLGSKINFEDTEQPVIVVEELFIENGIDVERGLIVDDGYEIVYGTCSACHSIDLVTQNSATREGWKELIVWMQQTQKLWDLGDSEAVILDYLEKNYAPKEQGRRAPLKDIEWYEL